MVFDSWLENLKSTGGLASRMRTLSRPPRRKPAARRRLQLEALEDRFLLSTFTVTNISDTGAGSFRDAITQVNADTQPGTDTVDFAIGSGAQTITPLSNLPTITHAMVIDGTSQPGFAGIPLISLSGVGVPFNGASHNGLTITANNSTIKDLIIRQFTYGNGVDIVGSGNVLQGNYIGTDVTGAQALHIVGSYGGSLLLSGASNLIGGTTAGARNLLAQGVAVRGSGNVVEGNYIGTDITGKVVLAAGFVFSPNTPYNTIGGTTPAAGNLIYSEPVVVNGQGVTLPAAPVLTSAVSSNGTITIGGTLHRGLNSTYTLNFFSDAAGTTLIGSGSVTTDATGTATFKVTLVGALSAGEVITATSVDGLYNTSMLSGGLGTDLAVAGFPSATTAGAAGSFTVRVQNLDGSTATTYAGTIHFSSSDPRAILPADYTFTAADRGVHTFGAILKTAGSNSLTATDTATGRIAGNESGIVVKPAAASQLVIGPPSSVTHGVAFSLTLTVEDAYGNVVTGYVGTLHFTSSDSTAALPANYTFTAGDAGIHTFTNKTTLKKKGTQTITVTDTQNGALTATDSTSVA